MASTSESTSNSIASTSNGASLTSTASAAAGSGSESMHFDQKSGKWIYENAETGQEFEWNTVANAWVPIVEEDVLQAQQAAYSVQGVDESAPANVLLARDRRKKRKAEDGGVAAPKKAVKAKPARQNTAVYLTNLPRDATVEEVASVFGKAGLILLDADGKPKVKLYNNHTTGEPNGEGLVVYYKEESVRLAINLLDDTPLRLGGNENIKVAEANWSHKENEGNTSDQDGEGGGASKEKKKKGKSDAVKQKMQRRAEKLLRDAADYDPGYDEKDNAVVAATSAAAAASGSTSTPATAKNAGGRVVVLQYVFTLEELAEDASLLLDLKEDVRDECESLGKVTNVVLYDKEPDGIVTIKFADPIAAQACIKKNNNRFFGGRQLKAWLYDGKKRYLKSGNMDSVAVEGESEDAAEARRLEEFGKWLEEDNA